MQKNRLFTITGGCGFIGGHLASALHRRGDRVRIIDDLSTGRREAAPAEADVMVADISDGPVFDAVQVWWLDDDIDGDRFYLSDLPSRLAIRGCGWRILFSLDGRVLFEHLVLAASALLSDVRQLAARLGKAVERVRCSARANK